MIRRLSEIIRERKDKELKRQKELDYIQKRVDEATRDMCLNQRQKVYDANNKQYFFNSNIYGEIFKQ